MIATSGFLIVLECTKFISIILHMSTIVLMRLHELCKTCVSLVLFLLFYFILAQSGKILVQDLFYFILFYCKWENRFIVVSRLVVVICWHAHIALSTMFNGE